MSWFNNIPLYHLSETQFSKTVPEGKNKKGCLVVCWEQDYTSESDKLLQKILKAIQYDLAKDCHLVKLSEHQEIALNIIKKRQNYGKILLFGVPGRQVGLNISKTPYEWYHVDRLDILLSHSLVELAKDKSLKAKLWNALKPLAD